MEIVWFFIGSFVFIYCYFYFHPNKNRGEKNYGELKAEVICPHCHVKGKVHTKPIAKKKGISGGKATAAILTAGVSLIAVGLSREDDMTEAHCINCDSTWAF